MVRVLATDHGWTLDPSEAARRRNAAFLERFVRAVDPVVPLLDIARAAVAHGRRLAIATGGTSVSLEPTLARLGIRDMFAVIVTRET
jgi:beta-phosphoglucomutase-like phosphatase (HAD superfamily)